MSTTPDETIALPETDGEPERDQESPAGAVAQELVIEDLLVEDVSIDGMCGVY